MQQQLMVVNTIREFIDSKGITPYKFCQATGVSQSTIYRLINHIQQIPDKEVLNKIINAYPGTSFDDLMNHQGDSQEVEQ